MEFVLQVTMETLKEAEKTTHHMVGVLVDNKSRTHNFESNLVINSLTKTMNFHLTRSPFLVNLFKRFANIISLLVVILLLPTVFQDQLK